MKLFWNSRKEEIRMAESQKNQTEKENIVELKTNIYLVKRIFKASGYTPNRTLISKIFKDLSCLQRIAA